MSPTFTVDDVGKPVESADGEALGTIVAVDDETAYVEPGSEIADSTRATLDWKVDDDDDTVPLSDESVSEVTDDAIRLDAAFTNESITGAEDEDRPEDADAAADSPASEPVTEADEDLGSRTDTPDEPGPGMDDLDDDAGDGALTDASTEIDGDEERGSTATEDPIEGLGGTDDRDPAEELDSVEAEGRRELEVDPTELTEEDPEAEIQPEEDVGQRTGGTDPGDRRGNLGAGESTRDAGAGRTGGDAEPDREGDDTERTADDDRNGDES